MSSGTYRPPPEGWVDFGTHAPLYRVPPLEFSDECGEDGLPLWERPHPDVAASSAQSRADKIAAAIVPEQLDQYLPPEATE